MKIAPGADQEPADRDYERCGCYSAATAAPECSRPDGAPRPWSPESRFVLERRPAHEAVTSDFKICRALRVIFTMRAS